MKMLFLAFLASGSLMTPATPPDPKPVMWAPCGYNDFDRATYFWQSPGGPECGQTDQYCYTSPPSRPEVRRGVQDRVLRRVVQPVPLPVGSLELRWRRPN